jgi:DNA polymerase-3 subunit alpha/error-prone DNA polymerase
MHGLPIFAEACRKAGIAPITGVEFADASGRLVLIARTRRGFSFLTRTLTAIADPGFSVAVSGAVASRREKVKEKGESGASIDTLREFKAEYAHDLFVLSDDPAALKRLKASSLRGLVSPQEREDGKADEADKVEEAAGSAPGPGNPDPWLFCLVTPCNRARWKALAATGIPPAASPEIRFLEPSHREVQRLLLAIGKKAGYWDVQEEDLDPETALWSYEALGLGGGRGEEEWPNSVRYGVPASWNPSAGWNLPPAWALPPAWPLRPAFYPWLAEAAANNARIAAGAVGDPFEGFHFPAYQGDLLSGDGGAPETTAETTAIYHREAGANSASRGARSVAAELGRMEPLADPRAGSAELLGALVREGAMRRYGRCDGAVAKRIAYEMSLITAKGFCDYFLIVRDIVRRASRVCGRGSAAASIVSYCLGITEVDPLRHDLYFERFLNPGRKDPPDIDIDFAWDERDEILDAVVKAYGPERVARVANHNCFRSKSALRETARAFGMPDGEISAFERSLRVDKDEARQNADEAWRKILILSRDLADMPRHLGAHSGGIVIVPDQIADYAPVEETGTGIRVLAWDKEGTEQAGLVKIDLLGNRSLAVVRDAVQSLQEQGVDLDRAGWRPIDDADTVALLARGDTMGVFYVESPAMRLLQKKTGRGDFEHLVIHSSIIRPAANTYINEYIDRLKGKPWKPLHPLLTGLFDESYGILCYQEDVSKAAIALAGFSSAEADGIRKILAKKDADTRLKEYWPAFESGACARGVDPATTKAVWDMIRSFSGYSFVKAHSASYAMLSFQSAYLRAHYPAQFMAAVMSNHGGFYSTLAYASEARRMGLKLLSPDVNKSLWRCRGEKVAGYESAEKAAQDDYKATGSGKAALGQEYAIRFGFCMVSSLSASVAQAILNERDRAGPFSSADQFARRIRFERSDAEALVGCGAFDSLSGGAGRAVAAGNPCGASRAEILMTLLSVYAFRENQAGPGERPRASGASGLSGALFPEDELDFGNCSAAPRPSAAQSPSPHGTPLRSALSPRRRRQAEFKYLGTTLDCHPLELWPRLFAQPRLRARDLDRHVGRRVRLLAWPITAKPVLTSSEEPMEFVSFEDESALFEAVLFPDAYKRFRHLLFEEVPLWVEGLAEKDRGAVTLTIESIKKGG